MRYLKHCLRSFSLMVEEGDLLCEVLGCMGQYIMQYSLHNLHFSHPPHVFTHTHTHTHTHTNTHTHIYTGLGGSTRILDVGGLPWLLSLRKKVHILILTLTLLKDNRAWTNFTSGVEWRYGQSQTQWLPLLRSIHIAVKSNSR